VKPQTEEFLYLMLWASETLFCPTWRNLADSFEAWACREGLMRRLRELERQKFLERSAASPDRRVLRLTEHGRLHALGGRDPAQLWARSWDQRWRLVIFDVPMGKDSERRRLRRYLRSRHFGYLQNSVWISPDPVETEREILAGADIDVETLVLMEAHPCGGESDAQIAAGAWDFRRVNEEYSRYLEVLRRRPNGAIRGELAARALQTWARNEREAWLAAVNLDPLLPTCLWPKGYLGAKAWNARIAALPHTREQITEFRT
jgi:phenylacetic acid degradation operon negative regulatory protein